MRAKSDGTNEYQLVLLRAIVIEPRYFTLWFTIIRIIASFFGVNDARVFFYWEKPSFLSESIVKYLLPHDIAVIRAVDFRQWLHWLPLETWLFSTFFSIVSRFIELTISYLSSMWSMQRSQSFALNYPDLELWAILVII